jgi:hypothetical protein
MKTTKTILATALIAFGMLVATASAASPGDKVCLQQDRSISKIMQGERNPLHVIPRAMMNPDQPIYLWPEGNPQRLDHDCSPNMNMK